MGVPFLLHEDHLDVSPTRSTFSFGSFSGLGEDRRGIEKGGWQTTILGDCKDLPKEGLSDLFRNLELGLPGKSGSFLNNLVKKFGPKCELLSTKYRCVFTAKEVQIIELIIQEFCVIRQVMAILNILEVETWP